ncbi:MAG: hypothetical protein GXO74_06925 [Calditrichaeota bacterium]|nr:hypothetical protein [Calditrichota bacterium]
MQEPKNLKFWASSRILIASFLIIILIGTALLSLPQAVHGQRLSLADALFTATSATCVTGLIVVDTGAKFTHFGQLVILIMIQLGGLGIMTFSTFFVFLLVGKFTFSERTIIQETMTQSPFKNIASLLKTIFFFTAFIEIVGGILLAFRFLPTMGLHKSLYFGIFHSISAFCNAGFSLFSDSFIHYRSDISVNLILITLIVLGGLGFVVLHEIRHFIFQRRKDKARKLSFHSRVVISISAVLIIAGTVIFFLLEWGNAIEKMPLAGKFFVSLFQSITCRTAGFNTVDISILSNSTLFFMIILMYIGASPGSCGGGIKTTTAGVIWAMLRARFKNLQEVNIAYRRLPEEIVSRAISIAFFSSVIIIVATILLMITEQGSISHQASRGLFLETLFEVVSAFGTVGLSTGITSTLSVAGKIILALTMFIGRLGPLTIALAIGQKQLPSFKYAQEKLLIG